MSESENYTKFGNNKLRQEFLDVCASATTIGQYRAVASRLLREYDAAVKRAELAVKYKDASEAERELGSRKEMGDSYCCHVDPLILEHRAIQAETCSMRQSGLLRKRRRTAYD